MNNDALSKDLYILDNENNPKYSKINKVWASTVLDQVIDQMSPDKKNLRQIISDLKHDILTGGKGSIDFPVTSVNGKLGDVIITKQDIGLGNVDNTSDNQKPLSQIQRNSINDLLKQYDFRLNLKDLYDHLVNYDNPHNVTLEKLNQNGKIEEIANKLINIHNTSINSATHGDIRLKLSTLWNYTEDLDKKLEGRLAETLNTAALHYTDANAHKDLFDKKENLDNKINEVEKDNVNNHNLYPSVQALTKYADIRERDLLDNKLLPIKSWISNIYVVDTDAALPTPKAELWNNVYYIKQGVSSNQELVICRKNGDDYEWEKLTLGSYSKIDPKYLFDKPDTGLSVKMENVLQEIFDSPNMGTIITENLKTLLSEAMKEYYKKDDINKTFIRKITIVPGKDNGCIQYYFNDDKDSLSDEVRVTGLKRLAYLEWVTENELHDKSVHENHIMDNSVVSRHLVKDLHFKGSPTIELIPGLDSNNNQIPTTEWVNLYVQQKLNNLNIDNNLLDKKADKKYVDDKLEEKADKVDINAKADLSVVNQKLELKADKELVDGKVDKSFFQFTDPDDGKKYQAKLAFENGKVFFVAEEVV